MSSPAHEPPRLLAVDIGNSRVKCAGFVAGRVGPATARRHEGAPSVVAGTVLSEVKRRKPQTVLVAGVVPELVANLLDELRRAECAAARFRADFDPIVEVATAAPDATGDDRVAAASAAFAAHGAPCLVINAGTAVTVDVVSAGGVFVGGAILPGPDLALSALASGAAQLPPVKAASPISALGRDTVQAMLSGCIIGTAGAIDRLVARLCEELGLADCPALLTGGAAEFVYEHLRTACRREPALVLQGLAVSYMRHVEKASGGNQ